MRRYGKHFKKILGLRLTCSRIALAGVVFGLSSCAFDIPEQTGARTINCPPAFSLESGMRAYFGITGSLNGQSQSGISVASASAPASAPNTRQVVVRAATFVLTINLASAAYGSKVIGLGNPDVWMSAVTCTSYGNCSSETYVAGEYNAVVRGSGTVTLGRTTQGNTEILVNATLPDANTSVTQSLQFQNLKFTESCY